MKATVTVEVTKAGKVLTTVVNHHSTGGFAEVLTIKGSTIGSPTKT